MIIHPGTVEVRSFGGLEDKVAGVAVRAETLGAFVLPVDFDPEISAALIGYSEAVILASDSISDLDEIGRRFANCEDAGGMQPAFVGAAEQYPDVPIHITRGLQRAIPRLRRRGEDVLETRLAVNAARPGEASFKFHRDAANQVAVIIAPDEFELHIPRARSEGGRRNPYRCRIPAGIVGVRGPASIWPLSNRAVRHKFLNPRPDQWRHSVVGDVIFNTSRFIS